MEKISSIQVGNELIIALTSLQRVFQYDVNKCIAKKIFPTQEHESKLKELSQNPEYTLQAT